MGPAGSTLNLSGSYRVNSLFVELACHKPELDGLIEPGSAG